MAPTAPKKRPSIRAKTTTSSSSFSGSGARSSSSSAFINSKSDKRIIKHSTFISRIEKTSKKPLKRRRPSKKLVTTMEGLADALPNVEELVKRNEGGKVEMKSLSHGRGFMKRRDKVEKGERERFSRNLGVIMASSGEGKNEVSTVTGGEVMAEGEVGKAPAPTPSATAGRFAAIRAWVNDNMEKHEGFEKKV